MADQDFDNVDDSKHHGDEGPDSGPSASKYDAADDDAEEELQLPGSVRVGDADAGGKKKKKKSKEAKSPKKSKEKKSKKDKKKSKSEGADADADATATPDKKPKKKKDKSRKAEGSSPLSPASDDHVDDEVASVDSGRRSQRLERALEMAADDREHPADDTVEQVMQALEAKNKGESADPNSKAPPAKFAGTILHGEMKDAALEYDEDEGDDEAPWIPPSLTKAQAYVKKHMYEGGTAPIWSTTMTELGTMGSGVTLYFRLLKYLTLLFLLLGILALPTAVFSYNGTGLKSLAVNADQIGWTVFSIGNLRTAATITTNATHSVTVEGTAYTGKQISLLVMTVDLFYSLVFVAFIIFLRARIRSVVKETDANNVTAGDYSVMVYGLPEDATPAEIRRHFSDLYQLTDPDWEFGGHCGCIGSKQSRLPQDLEDAGDLQEGEFIMPEDPVDPCRPVQDVSNSQDAEYLGSWVAEVSLAYGNGEAIRSFLSQQDLMDELRIARATAKKYAVDTPYAGGPNHKKRVKALQAIDRLQNRIQKLQAANIGFDTGTQAAFVVFNNEESYLRCCDDYDGSTEWYNKILQAPPLRFRRTLPLEVSAAAEPSTILWEHLDTPYFEQVMRRVFTGCLSILLILISFAIILTAQLTKESFAATIPAPELCETHLVASIYGQYSSVHAPQLLRDPRPGACEDPRFVHITYALNLTSDFYNHTFIEQMGIYNGTTIPSISVYDWANNTGPAAPECNQPCVDPDTTTTCVPVGCTYPRWKVVDSRFGCNTANFTATAPLNCYCTQALYAHVKDRGWTGWFTVWFRSESACRGFIRRWGSAKALQYMAPVAITVVNTVLTFVLKALARFEHHRSVSEESHALASKLFWFQFINTGIVTLLVFAKMPTTKSAASVAAATATDTASQSAIPIFQGEFDEFTTKWYTVVGSSLMLTMLINVVVPHIVPLFKFLVVHPLKKRFSSKSAVTQRQLNGILAGPPFDMVLRFPTILVFIFIPLLYSGGMPIFLFMSSIFFFITFWIDKVMLLRYFTKPPNYDEALASLALGLLPWALIFHLGFSCWMYATSSVLETQQVNLGQLFNTEALPDPTIERLVNSTVRLDTVGITPRLVKQDTFLLAVFLLVILCVLFIAAFFGNLVRKTALFLFEVISCGLFVSRQQSTDDRSYIPPYTAVFERELNPQYEYELLDKEIADGWVLQTDPQGRQWISKVWLEDGLIDGVKHYRGTKKRTWEVIRDNDLHSYIMNRHPRYRDCLIDAMADALKLPIENVADDMPDGEYEEDDEVV